MGHGWVVAGCVRCDKVRVRSVACGGGGGGVQRWGVSDEAHGEEDDEEVEPYGEVSEPAELLEGADLANEEACEGPDKAADGVAELEFGGFGESFAVGNNDDGNIADELDGLQDVHAVTSPIPI